MKRQTPTLDVLDRLELYTEQACDSATGRALTWLHECQNHDGSWGRSTKIRPVFTALVLLAFMSHGDTYASERYPGLKKAYRYLTEILSSRKEPAGLPGMPFHAVAGTACFEAYGFTKAPALKAAGEHALTMLLDSKELPTFWDVMALKSAMLAGLENPEITAKARDVVKSFDRENECARSTAGLISMILQNKEKLAKTDLEFLARQPQFDWENPSDEWQMNEWYKHTVACFLAGGETWNIWNKSFAVGLVNAQGWKRHWEHPGRRTAVHKVFGQDDQQVYTTSMAVLMLNIYYRHLSFYRFGFFAPSDLKEAECPYGEETGDIDIQL